MSKMLEAIELRSDWAEAPKAPAPTSDDSFPLHCPCCNIRYRIPKLTADISRIVRCLRCGTKFVLAVRNPC
jgi:hypothetical protein